MKWFAFALVMLIAPLQVFAQLAPTGGHYAGRPSDTGYGGTFVSATGTFAAAIPLELPAARGGLPIPLQIRHGAGGVGAAGVGWDLPLSYIQRDMTFAHRRPASSPGARAEPRERAYLSLFGQSVELVRKGGVWVARSGSLELMARESAGSWLAYDGQGRTYTFIRPANLGSTGLWLLKSVSVAGGASIQLTYQITISPLNGGSGSAINLVRIAYNTHAAAGCAKNEVALTYGHESITPLSISLLGDQVLVRKNTLTLLDVRSRATCGTPFERLRRYAFQYLPDADTYLPRLRTVRMFGRQGTQEENMALPIATYNYGSATQNGTLRYEMTQTVDLPTGAAHNQVSSTTLDASVNAPVKGHGYATWQTLTDVTGDGRPDLVFKGNDKLWVAYNRPALDHKTTLGVGGQAIAQLSDDATFANGAFSTHTTAERRFAYAPANRNTTNVWRQAIDVNGDGRIDIVDAAEEADRWVVYLNTPGGATGVKWERRSFLVKSLREALVGRGHAIDSVHVPLSRRATGTDLKQWVCWRWNGKTWVWYANGFSNHRCQGVAQQISERGPERTFVEWELTDLNGDGYPDFVFNSSPVDFQLHRPPKELTPVTGAVYPSDFGIGGPLWFPFAPRLTNEVRASFNVLGVRFFTDHDQFSRSVNLFAASSEWGVSEWRCTGWVPAATTCDESSQSHFVGFVDVNGDGLVDRVVGNRAYLGAYHSRAFMFSKVYITLPGPLAMQRNTHKEQCGIGGGQRPTTDQTRGLRDLTGDGIPDYYDNSDVWIGTGTEFRPAINIALPGGHFRFSHQTESCDGDMSNTDGGLFDIDGDGRPEVIGLVGSTFVVSQLAGGQASGKPEVGRLTEIDNGYGAKTSITYVSAKHFTNSPVPFPEIVVGSVATTGTQNLGGTLAGTRYAYSNAELIFDSALDRFTFPGYGRRVEIGLFDMPGGEVAKPLKARIMGAAVITDTWPLMPFSSSLTKQQRWRRMKLVGQVRDIFRLRGIADPDPWSLLSVDANDGRVIGVTHFKWDAKLYEAPVSPTTNGVDCLEMVLPLDFSLSVAHNLGNWIDVCRAHGFAFGTSRESWYGAWAPPTSNNVQTQSRALEVDDFGRVIFAEYAGDRFRSDDDVCVENTFATPNGTFPRVLTALASRRVTDCGRRIAYASESFTYDGLPTGVVSNGRMTSHSVDRRATDNGALLRTARAFDASYDSAGNLVTVRTQRDGATRTVTFGYDLFGLVPISSKLAAAGVASTQSFVSYDPISLHALSSTDANGTHAGADFDGFGRLVRRTVTPPGGPLGVMSSVSYHGFSSVEPDGRRVVVKSFSDPVAQEHVASAAGRSRTVFLDELGRTRRTELALGGDYANEVLVLGSRTYDGLGRVVFEADAYPKSQDSATAYGTSYHFKNTGDLDCIIRGRGQQALNHVTNVDTERFPTCFDRLFIDHVETLEVRDAASLQAGSPHSGVVKRLVSSAIGRVIERSTVKAGTRLDYAAFSHDRLGQQTSMTRFLDPVAGTNPVQWRRRLDSVGQMLRLEEPQTATRFHTYSDWGELVQTQWTDGTIDRRLVRQYDALGRLTATEERNDGLVDPETVNEYAYDVGANFSPLTPPTFVLGRLARASSPNGQVAFSYDALGRVNARTFSDNQNGIYIEKREYHADGRPTTLEFNLPDNNFDAERVKYSYDSAARLRTMTHVDASGDRVLYNADFIDPFGRVRKAFYGRNTVFQGDYADEGRRLMKEARVESSLGSRRVIFLEVDPLGRELSRREIKNGAASGPKTNVSYDTLGRLAIAVQTEGEGTATLSTRQFSYDALGNTLALVDAVGAADAALSYGAVDRDRLCRIGYGDGGLGGTACNVTHDVLGNVVSQPTRTGSRQLSYFSSGSIRTITEQDTQARFKYDPFGQVQELDVQGGTSQDKRRDRRYGGNIERRDAVSGGSTMSFITRHIPGPDGIVASQRGAGDEWVFGFGELRGNRVFTNEAGAFVQDVDYQPFGEANSIGAVAGSPSYTKYQWNGGDALAAFSLSHLGARIYDPVIGRFLSRDPLVVLRSASNTNPYAFAANDPINFADRTGLDKDLEKVGNANDYVGGLLDWTEHFIGPTFLDTSRMDFVKSFLFDPPVVTDGMRTIGLGGFIRTGALADLGLLANGLGKASDRVGIAIKGVEFLSNPSLETGLGLEREVAETFLSGTGYGLAVVWGIKGAEAAIGKENIGWGVAWVLRPRRGFAHERAERKVEIESLRYAVTKLGDKVQRDLRALSELQRAREEALDVACGTIPRPAECSRLFSSHAQTEVPIPSQLRMKPLNPMSVTPSTTGSGGTGSSGTVIIGIPGGCTPGECQNPN